MGFKTFQQLQQKVMIELTAAGGPDVQTYLQPRIAQKLQRAFNDKFKTRWWTDFFTVGTYVLDGTTGHIVEDVTNLIKSYRDIKFVWPLTMRNPLPELQQSTNQNMVTQYSLVADNSATTHGYFKVMPITMTGSLLIAYRTEPDDFIDTDVVKFDEDYLVLTAAGQILMEDGTNMVAAKKMLDDAQKFYNSYYDDDTRKEKSMYPATVTNVDNWNTR